MSHRPTLASPLLAIGHKVGILGGGQLSAMLCEAATRMGLRPVVLAKSPLDPAARVCTDTLIGAYSDLNVLRRFLAEVDLVAFENEFIPADLLAQARSPHTRFVPELDTLLKLQNKAAQKQLLAELNVPTAPFEVFHPSGDSKNDSSGDIVEWVSHAFALYPQGFVLKWSHTGYDGKGVALVREDDSPALRKDLEKFCRASLQRGGTVYLEPYVPFLRELALVACHGVNGDFACYPLVVIEQPKGICRWVKGPATALGVNSTLQVTAQQRARDLAQSLSLYGTFAIEFFELPTGELWVNEISPRVHNSGHFSQDAAQTNQFENHWRAILGLPLGETTTSEAFAMLNLLGPDAQPSDRELSLPPVSPRVHLHWYGKADLLPGRKLGHYNGSAESVDALPSLIAEMEACERLWLGLS